jgi:hypothetical protein
MIRRPFSGGSRRQLCQICEFLQARRLDAHSAKRPFVTLNTASQRRAKIYQECPTKSMTAVLLATPKTSPRVKQRSSLSNLQSFSITRTMSRNSTIVKRRDQPADAQDGNLPSLSAQQLRQRQQSDFTDSAELIAAVERVTRLFLAQQGIPSEETTFAALRACANADVKLVADSESQAEVARRESQSESTASHLLNLDNGGGNTAVSAHTNAASNANRPQNVIDTLSESAYIIITDPKVVITPRLLEEYINVQARLGRPETLPQVLSLYASKPRPRLVAGNIQYVEQQADKADHAIEAAAAETALDAAIEAKNLDAAIGIIENSYATKAFVKSKLLKQAVIPGAAFAATPVAAYFLATSLSHLQTSMDPNMATNIAFAAILAYVGFTATIGVVVVTTANDQMKRVTWAPGTPLRQRWMREDERAALDKVACSFGFSESHRYGEEEGAEFQALREYILRRGMILDAVELMEGMT